MSNNEDQLAPSEHPHVPQATVSNGLSAIQTAQLDENTSMPAQVAAPPPPPAPVASVIVPPPAPSPAQAPFLVPTSMPIGVGVPQAPAVTLPVGDDPLNSKQHVKRMSKQQQLIIEIRNIHWPDVKAEDLWLLDDGKRGGFAQVPRTLSTMMTIINDIIKRRDGKAMPAGKTYLVLWLHVFGAGMVRIDSEEDAAFEAGYGGERNVSTFRTHMKMLRELGFIDFREGPKGPMQYVLMLNPYKVMKRLQIAGLVPLKQYVALLERASVIGSGKELKD